MNTSVIRYRVADFLKDHAPFDALPGQVLIELAGQGRVKFHESGEEIFRQGQAKTPWVWVIQQGRVELVDDSSGAAQLRDVLGQGDLLGLERFGGDGAYLSTARTASDVIVYALDAGAFESLAVRHPAVQRYLAAHSSVLGTSVGRRSWLDAEAPDLAFLEARTRVLHSTPEFADSPAIDVPFTTRSAVRKMVSARAEALNAANTVLTAADLALFCDRNPALLLRLIRHASSIAELAPLLRQASRLVLDGLAHSSDVDDCSHIATEAVSAAAATCIRFAQEDAGAAGIEPPSAPYCWLAFGAMARGEMLRLAPPRIGVVYDDEHLSAEDLTSASAYFNVVAGQVGAWFHACGLDGEAAVWPKGSHPAMPLSEWKRFFGDTIQTPFECDLFARREFFDFRQLSGDPALLTALTSHIAKQLEQTEMLIPLLANDTLAHLPPLTVFRGLVLDSDGSERDSLNLAEFIVNPISDAARVFALGNRTQEGGEAISTLDRLEAAAQDAGENAPVFRDAAEAFRVGLYHQATGGTPLLAPAALGKLDQRVMKTGFASILRLLELTASTFAARS